MIHRLLAIALGLLGLGLAVFGFLEWWSGDNWRELYDDDENGWASA